MKRLVKPFLYATVVMLVSVSCERKAPCDDGTCCGPSPQKLAYVQSLVNAKADVGNDCLVIENIGTTWFCVLQQDGTLVQSLKQTYINGKPQPFKYRVWGKIFDCVNCPVSQVGVRVQYIQVEKIEQFN
ncbi:hypothetical protein [Runella sp. SP2]|uniref:hypothetical protein n=1 Tax=Runella sp. SP2 TaxID=2268026 RepID=UPI000F08A637|nr:hypothetical protein [Runella sp. SP2]AYQ34478.1 hypothetical protein DTQ70_20950 [Runella sp. SP2]